MRFKIVKVKNKRLWHVKNDKGDIILEIMPKHIKMLIRSLNQILEMESMFKELKKILNPKDFILDADTINRIKTK